MSSEPLKDTVRTGSGADRIARLRGGPSPSDQKPLCARRALRCGVEKITDRAANPFGLDIPCAEIGGRGDPVPGYGDPNGDFHAVGDHPGRHGGARTGVPFTGCSAGRALQAVFHEHGFAAESYADRPEYDDLYTSYLYPCLPATEDPTGPDYDAAERYVDAELRAVNAHVLVPIGERPVRRVLANYTSHGEKLDDATMEALHARELRGTGFMVVPVKDPTEWSESDRSRLDETLGAVLASDYRQTKGVATRIG